jgi:hypothetical protein
VIWGRLQYVIYGLVAAYIGIRLWADAERFGEGEGDDSPQSSVGLSRNLLLQGFAIGAAVWMFIPMIPLLAGFLAVAAGEKVQRGTGATPGNPYEFLVEFLVQIAFGFGLLLWAASLSKRTAMPTEATSEDDASGSLLRFGSRDDALFASAVGLPLHRSSIRGIAHRLGP